MELDDGTGDVTPGEHIALQGGDLDLGPASYDSDHDGVADSVVIAQGDLVMVVTDSDHDGDADSVTAYDADGNQVDPSTGEPIDPGADPGHDGPTVDPVSHDDPGTDPGHDDPGTDAGGITVAGTGGAPVAVGDPTVDIDKDGRPDTAVVKGADGSTTGYTDRDGDGHADQITQISADGSVVVAVDEGDGWQVVATGHIDADGAMVQDPTPDPNAQIHTPQGADPQTDPQTDPHNGPQQDPQDPQTDPQAPHSDPQGPGTEPSAPAGDITISKDGQDYDLGSPTADMDGDGRADTVVAKQDDGSVVGFTDVDGNGTADRITQISPDGSVVIAEQDGSGQWHQIATGHIGPDGQYVPDQADGAAVGS